MSVRRLAENSRKPSPSPGERGECEEIAKYPEGREASAVISLLWLAQKQNDYWLPKPAIEKVAQKLGMPLIRVLEIATFYTMFNLAPVGKYSMSRCAARRPACSRGSDAIKEMLRAADRRARAGDGGRRFSPGSKSNVSAPAAMRRWCRSTRIITRI